MTQICRMHKLSPEFQRLTFFQEIHVTYYKWKSWKEFRIAFSSLKKLKIILSLFSHLIGKKRKEITSQSWKKGRSVTKKFQLWKKFHKKERGQKYFVINSAGNSVFGQWQNSLRFTPCRTGGIGWEGNLSPCCAVSFPSFLSFPPFSPLTVFFSLF